MKEHLKKLNTERVFLLVQVVLYITFLALDLTDKNADLSNKVKYVVIILCFCYAFFAGKGTVRFLKAALLFTVLADLFLLILDYYLWGVLVFIVVQQLYSIRLVVLERNSSVTSGSAKHTTDIRNNRKKHISYDYLLRVMLQVGAAIIVCAVLKIAGISLELLSIVSIYYFILISSNVVSAVILARSTPGNKENILYAAGMFLFLLCDINVGFYNLSGFITLPVQTYHLIYSISSILMWTFYAPAQVLIAVSSRYSEKQPIIEP